MVNLHCFSEIDIDTDEILDESLYQALFNQCEMIGFMVEMKERILEFSGPFDVPDMWNNVTFSLRWNNKKNQIVESYWDLINEDGDRKRYYAYHFISGEVNDLPAELNYA